MNKELKIINEGNDIYSIELAGKYKGEKKFFLEKGKFIIEQINENLNINLIIENYLKKFKCNKDKSCEDVISFINELVICNLIDEKILNDIDCKSKINSNMINILTEKDVLKVSKYITHKILNKEMIYSNSYDIKSYNPYNLRMKIFSNKEIYFYEMSPMDNIISLVGIQVTDDMPAQILIMANDKGNDISKILNYIEEYLHRRKIFKIKLCYVSENLTENILEENGFKKEAILIKEYKGQDLIIMSKFLMENNNEY